MSRSSNSSLTHAAYKTGAPSAVALARPTANGRVLVLGRGRGRGGAPSTRLNAPKPLSLPSLKKENKGFDPNISVLPAGGAGWGSGLPASEAFADDDESESAAGASEYPRLQHSGAALLLFLR